MTSGPGWTTVWAFLLPPEQYSWPFLIASRSLSSGCMVGPLSQDTESSLRPSDPGELHMMAFLFWYLLADIWLIASMLGWFVQENVSSDQGGAGITERSAIHQAVLSLDMVVQGCPQSWALCQGNPSPYAYWCWLLWSWADPRWTEKW